VGRELLVVLAEERRHARRDAGRIDPVADELAGLAHRDELSRDDASGRIAGVDDALVHVEGDPRGVEVEPASEGTAAPDVGAEAQHLQRVLLDREAERPSADRALEDDPFAPAGRGEMRVASQPCA